MLSTLIDLNFNLSHVQEVDINPYGKRLGHHVTIFNKEGEAIGGGCSEQKEAALRTATAEVIERALFRKISSSEKGIEFFMQSYPTTCGFAAGFDFQKTLGRSELEAYERWAWSKWIDQKYYIPRTSIGLRYLSPLSQFFHQSFDEVQFYHLKFFANRTLLHLGITLGFKEGGIFPGSRVAVTEGEIWQHALLETWRHYISFVHMKKFGKAPNSIVDERIQLFGNDASCAVRQIPITGEECWPQPKLALQRTLKIPNKEIYLARSLCLDFVGWHLGSANRFVY